MAVNYWRDCLRCKHVVWGTHSLNLQDCTECPDGKCQPPAENAAASIPNRQTESP